MEYNFDKELVALNDAICEFERASGRHYTLVLIPHRPDEPIHVSHEGKPVPDSTRYQADISFMTAFAQREISR